MDGVVKALISYKNIEAKYFLRYPILCLGINLLMKFFLKQAKKNIVKILIITVTTSASNIIVIIQ